MPLWGEPEWVHVQNVAQLHAYDCYQNVTEPHEQATEITKKVHLYVQHRNRESGRCL